MNQISIREELGQKSLIMDWQSSRNKKWLRCVATILIICFVNQDLVWAQEGTPVWSKGQNGNFALKPPVNPVSPISVPKDIAITKDIYKSSGDKTIINIQDAHASATAQQSIVSILDSLVANYDLKLVAIEGSTGYIDTSLLRTFPDEAIRKRTAQYLMKKGKMSAGEFFSITSDKEVAVYGIEDKPLYLENVEEFKNIYAINESTKADISNLISALNNLKDKIYSDDLKTLEHNSVLHKDGKLTFSDRWSFVNALGAKLGVRYENYENLSKLVKSMKMEKGIDFEKANKERDELIDALSKKMVKSDLEQLVLKSLSFKTNKISQGEYYIFLQELAQKYGVEPEPYKMLIKYTEYITLYESIDLLEIFEEVRKYEESIKEKIFTNDYQKKLSEYSRFIELVRDVYELKLTNGDLAELVSDLNTSAVGTRNPHVTAEVLASFIKDASLKYGVAIEGNYDLGKIFDNIPAALSFYKTAEERNSAILANTINRMQQSGQSVAALITGGYHTKGMTNILKQKETSYVVILPKFDSSKGERPYIAILTNKKEPYEKLLESGQYFLATTSYFAGEDNFRNQRDVTAFLREIVFVAMAQAVLEGNDPKGVRDLWLNAFDARQKQLDVEGKSGVITRGDAEKLVDGAEFIKVEGKEPFVMISAEGVLLRVAAAGDELIRAPTPDEIARFEQRKNVLARRKGGAPAKPTAPVGPAAPTAPVGHAAAPAAPIPPAPIEPTAPVGPERELSSDEIIQKIDDVWAQLGSMVNQPFSPEAQIAFEEICKLTGLLMEKEHFAADAALYLKIIAALLYGRGDYRKVIAFFNQIKDADPSFRDVVLGSRVFVQFYFIAVLEDPDSFARIGNRRMTWVQFASEELGPHFDVKKILGDTPDDIISFWSGVVDTVYSHIDHLRRNGRYEEALTVLDSMLNMMRREKEIDPASGDDTIDTLLGFRSDIMKERALKAPPQQPSAGPKKGRDWYRRGGFADEATLWVLIAAASACVFIEIVNVAGFIPSLLIMFGGVALNAALKGWTSWGKGKNSSIFQRIKERIGDYRIRILTSFSIVIILLVFTMIKHKQDRFAMANQPPTPAALVQTASQLDMISQEKFHVNINILPVAPAPQEEAAPVRTAPQETAPQAPATPQAPAAQTARRMAARPQISLLRYRDELMRVSNQAVRIVLFGKSEDAIIRIKRVVDGFMAVESMFGIRGNTIQLDPIWGKEYTNRKTVSAKNVQEANKILTSWLDETLPHLKDADPAEYIRISNLRNKFNADAAGAKSLAAYRLAAARSLRQEMVQNTGTFLTLYVGADYFSKDSRLPKDTADCAAVARYWKEYWNTPAGKGMEWVAEIKLMLADENRCRAALHLLVAISPAASDLTNAKREVEYASRNKKDPGAANRSLTRNAALISSAQLKFNARWGEIMGLAERVEKGYSAKLRKNFDNACQVEATSQNRVTVDRLKAELQKQAQEKPKPKPAKPTRQTKSVKAYSHAFLALAAGLGGMNAPHAIIYAVVAIGILAMMAQMAGGIFLLGSTKKKAPTEEVSAPTGKVFIPPTPGIVVATQMPATPEPAKKGHKPAEVKVVDLTAGVSHKVFVSTASAAPAIRIVRSLTVMITTLVVSERIANAMDGIQALVGSNLTVLGIFVILTLAGYGIFKYIKLKKERAVEEPVRSNAAKTDALSSFFSDEMSKDPVKQEYVLIWLKGIDKIYPKKEVLEELKGAGFEVVAEGAEESLDEFQIVHRWKDLRDTVGKGKDIIDQIISCGSTAMRLDFGRIMAEKDPARFNAAFRSWLASVEAKGEEEEGDRATARLLDLFVTYHRKKIQPILLRNKQHPMTGLSGPDTSALDKALIARGVEGGIDAQTYVKGVVVEGLRARLFKFSRGELSLYQKTLVAEARKVLPPGRTTLNDAEKQLVYQLGLGLHGAWNYRELIAHDLSLLSDSNRDAFLAAIQASESAAPQAEGEADTGKEEIERLKLLEARATNDNLPADERATAWHGYQRAYIRLTKTSTGMITPNDLYKKLAPQVRELIMRDRQQKKGPGHKPSAEAFVNGYMIIILSGIGLLFILGLYIFNRIADARSLFRYRETLTEYSYNSLDEYDREHFKWDGEYWRKVDEKGRWTRLVLGTAKDVKPSTKPGAPPTAMENHVAIRMKAGYTIYAFDAHSDSPDYLKEAEERGEVAHEGNNQLWIDDHPDIFPTTTGPGAHPALLADDHPDIFSEETADLDARVALTIAERNLTNKNWLKSHIWVYFTKVWGKDRVVGDSWKKLASLVPQHGSYSYSSYFTKAKRPCNEKAIFNIDSDATDDTERVLKFVEDCYQYDGVTPSTVHLCTSPPNVGPDEDGYPSRLDGLYYPRGFGNVGNCNVMAERIPHIFAERLRGKEAPIVTALRKALNSRIFMVMAIIAAVYMLEHFLIHGGHGLAIAGPGAMLAFVAISIAMMAILTSNFVNEGSDRFEQLEEAARTEAGIVAVLVKHFPEKTPIDKQEFAKAFIARTPPEILNNTELKNSLALAAYRQALEVLKRSEVPHAEFVEDKPGSSDRIVMAYMDLRKGILQTIYGVLTGAGINVGADRWSIIVKVSHNGVARNILVEFNDVDENNKKLSQGAKDEVIRRFDNLDKEFVIAPVVEYKGKSSMKNIITRGHAAYTDTGSYNDVMAISHNIMSAEAQHDVKKATQEVDEQVRKLEEAVLRIKGSVLVNLSEPLKKNASGKIDICVKTVKDRLHEGLIPNRIILKPSSVILFHEQIKALIKNLEKGREKDLEDAEIRALIDALKSFDDTIMKYYFEIIRIVPQGVEKDSITAKNAIEAEKKRFDEVLAQFLKEEEETVERLEQAAKDKNAGDGEASSSSSVSVQRTMVSIIRGDFKNRLRVKAMRSVDELLPAWYPFMEEALQAHEDLELLEEQRVALSMSEDEYQKMVKTIRGPYELVKKFIKKLKGVETVFKSFKDIPDGEKHVLFLKGYILPSEVVDAIKNENLTAIVTTEANITTHWVIVAKDIGIPVFFVIDASMDDVMNKVSIGSEVVLDGPNETLAINPDRETTRGYDKKAMKLEALKRYYDERRSEPSPVHVFANAEDAGSVKEAISNAADGIGLVRTEVWLIKDLKDCIKNIKAPEERERLKKYLKGRVIDMIEQAHGRPVTFRVFDAADDKEIAGEKPARTGLNYFRTPVGETPVGEELLLVELESIFEALLDRHAGNITIEFPRVETEEDAADIYKKWIPKARNKVAKNLKEQELISRAKVVSMIETVRGVSNTEIIAQYADGIAIGISDLIRDIYSDIEKSMGVENLRLTIKAIHLFTDIYPNTDKWGKRDKVLPHYIGEILQGVMRVQRIQKRAIPIVICGDMASQDKFIAYISYLRSQTGLNICPSVPYTDIPRVKEMLRYFKGMDLLQAFGTIDKEVDERAQKAVSDFEESILKEPRVRQIEAKLYEERTVLPAKGQKEDPEKAQTPAKTEEVQPAAPRKTVTLRMVNEHGMHLRVATKVAALLNKHKKIKVTVVCASLGLGRPPIENKKIEGLMDISLLAATKGSEMTLDVKGKDAGSFIKDLLELTDINKEGKDEPVFEEIGLSSEVPGTEGTTVGPPAAPQVGAGIDVAVSIDPELESQSNVSTQIINAVGRVFGDDAFYQNAKFSKQSVRGVKIRSVRGIVGRDVVTVDVQLTERTERLVIVLYRRGYNLNPSISDHYEQLASRIVYMYRDFELQGRNMDAIESTGLSREKMMDIIQQSFRDSIVEDELTFFEEGTDSKVYLNKDKTLVVKELKSLPRNDPLAGYKLAQEKLGHLAVRFLIIDDLKVNIRNKEGNIVEKTMKHAIVQKYVPVLFKGGDESTDATGLASLINLANVNDKYEGLLVKAIAEKDIETAKMLIEQFVVNMRAMLARGIFDWDAKSDNYGYDTSVGRVASFDMGKFIDAYGVERDDAETFVTRLQTFRNNLRKFAKMHLDEASAEGIVKYFEESVSKAFYNPSKNFHFDISKTLDDLRGESLHEELFEDIREMARSLGAAGAGGIPVCYVGSAATRRFMVKHMADYLKDNVRLEDLERTLGVIGFEEEASAYDLAVSLNRPYLPVDAAYISMENRQDAYFGAKVRHLKSGPTADRVLREGVYGNVALSAADKENIQKGVVKALLRYYDHEKLVYDTLAKEFALDRSVNIEDTLAVEDEFSKIKSDSLTEGQKLLLKKLLGITKFDNLRSRLILAFDKLREVRRFPFEVTLRDFIIGKDGADFAAHLIGHGVYIRKARENEVIKEIASEDRGISIPYEVIFKALIEEKGQGAASLFLERVYYQEPDDSELRRLVRSELVKLYGSKEWKQGLLDNLTLSMGSEITVPSKSSGAPAVLSAKPLILVGIPRVGSVENRTIVEQSITGAAAALGENVRVEVFPDQGDEIRNYEYVTKLARERGARIGIPAANNFIESAVSRAAIDAHTNEFLACVSADYFRLTNPDIAKLNETLATLKSKDELRSMLARLSKVLRPAVAERMLALDAYNTRMTNITAKIAMPGLTPEATEAIKDAQAKYIVNMRADSEGELKLLAEEHRNKMKLAEGKEPPVRIQVRFVVEDGAKKASLDTAEAKAALLKKAGIDDVINNPDDLIVLTKDDAKELSVKEICDRYVPVSYDTKHVVVVDSERRGRPDENILGEIVFMEYEDIATPAVYDAAIELVTRGPGLGTPPPGFNFRVSETGKWLILPVMKRVDYRLLKDEIERYNEIIRSA